MLNFLVKIATYLDSKGHNRLAKELDGLTEKLAQDASLIGARGPLQRERKPEKSTESLASVLGKVVQMAWVQSTDPSPDASISANQMFAALADTPEYDDLGATNKAANAKLIKVLESLDAISGNANPNNKMQNEWSDVVDNGKAALEALTGKPVAPSKAKRKPNALVMQIQKNLGLAPDGYWTPETNSKFIEAMNSYPAYAKYMQDGKFKGNLQLAAQLTMQLAELGNKEAPQQGMAAQAPAQQSSWKSKWHQMTPAALEALNKLDKLRPGQAQTAIDAVDKVPSQTQKDFEDALKDMADSAADTSGTGRLNETYRRQ